MPSRIPPRAAARLHCRSPAGAPCGRIPHQPAGMFRAQPAASDHPGRGASQDRARCSPSRGARRGHRALRPGDQRHGPAARIGVAGGVVAVGPRRPGHGCRPTRQPDLPATQRVDRHCRAFRAVLVIARRGRGPARIRHDPSGPRRRTAAGGCAARRCPQPEDLSPSSASARASNHAQPAGFPAAARAGPPTGPSTAALATCSPKTRSGRQDATSRRKAGARWRSSSCPLHCPAWLKGWQGGEPVQTDRSPATPARRSAQGQPPIPAKKWHWVKPRRSAGSTSRMDRSSTSPAGSRPAASSSRSQAQAAGSASL